MQREPVDVDSIRHEPLGERHGRAKHERIVTAKPPDDRIGQGGEALPQSDMRSLGQDIRRTKNREMA